MQIDVDLCLNIDYVTPAGLVLSSAACDTQNRIGCSSTDISQAGKGYPSLGTVRFALPAILTSCDKPEDPNTRD